MTTCETEMSVLRARLVAIEAISARLAELLRGAVCDERCDGGEHMDFCYTVFSALAEHDTAVKEAS